MKTKDSVNGDLIALWSTDATAVGTTKVADLFIDTNSIDYSQCRTMVSDGTNLIFTVTRNPARCELWVSDGTTNGTFPAGIPGNDIGDILGVNSNKLFFAYYMGDYQLGAIDFPVMNPASVSFTQLSSGIGNIVEIPPVLDNDYLYFAVEEANSDRYLYRSNGGAVEKIAVTCVSFLSKIVASQGSIYYYCGGRLMRSNGTTAGTVDIGSLEMSYYTRFKEVNNVLYLITNEDISTVSLYSISGSTITKISTVFAGSGNVYDIPTVFESYNNYIIFTADRNNGFGTELYSYDTVSTAITRLTDNAAGALNTFVPQKNAARGYHAAKPSATLSSGVLFFPEYGVNAGEPWITDGTLSGTSIIKDVNSGSQNYSHLPWDNSASYYLFSTDNFANPLLQVMYAGEIYFPLDDGIHGPNLWKTDGTLNNTTRVSTYSSGTKTSLPVNNRFTLADNQVLYGFDDGVHGREYWAYNLDTKTAALAYDSETGNRHHTNDYFSDIFKTTKVNNYFLSNKYNDQTGLYELWSLDLTSIGSATKIFESGPNGDEISYHATGDTLDYFVAQTLATGNELFKTDGTLAGTSIVKELEPGTTSAYNPNFSHALVGDLLLLGSPVRDTIISNGTSAGTSYVYNDGNQSMGNSSGEFAGAGKFFYNAHNGNYVYKPYSVNYDGTGITQLDSSINYDYKGSNTHEVLYLYDDPTLGTVLKSTTGALGSDQLVFDPDPGSANGTFEYYATMTFPGKTCFIVDEGASRPLYCYTRATSTLEAMLPNNTSAAIEAYLYAERAEIFKYNNKYYFMANDATHGTELWVTDGTVLGTKLYFEFEPGSTSANITMLGLYGSEYLFIDVATNKLGRIDLNQ